MKDRIINITEKQFEKVQKIIDAKAEIHAKIREGRFSEIKTDVKFVKPVRS